MRCSTTASFRSLDRGTSSLRSFHAEYMTSSGRQTKTFKAKDIDDAWSKAVSFQLGSLVKVSTLWDGG